MHASLGIKKLNECAVTHTIHVVFTWSVLMITHQEGIFLMQLDSITLFHGMNFNLNK